MLPKRLEIKNFLAYRSPDAVVFDGIHLACITGPNGAGKSSLLDAITWALWGKARARRDEELVHLGQQDMYVQLDFEHEGTIYRVVRRRTRKSGGASTLDLFVVDGGSLQTRSESSIRATQQKINDLLRMDYETFVHSAFLQQGRADAFTTKAPAQRKQILADILGLERWAAYEETAKETLKGINENLAVVEATIAGIDEELAREPELRSAFAAATQAHAEAEAALEAAEANLREVEHAPNALQNAQKQKAALERQAQEHERDLRTVLAEIKAQQEKIAEYENVLAMREEIEQGFAALQSAREADDTLGGKLMQLQALDNQRHDLQRQLDAARAELEAKATHCRSAIAQLQRTIQAARPDDLSAAQAEVLALEALEAQRDQVDAEVRQLETARAELKGGNDKLRQEMHEIKSRIERLKVVQGATCPTCGQPLTESHRASVLDEWQAEGTKRGNLYRANVAELESMEKQIAALKSRLEELNAEVRRLSAAKQRVAALQAGVDAANEAAARLDQEQARLDEIQMALDTQAYGEAIRVLLASVDAEREALGYDRGAHSAAKEQVKTYAIYEARQRQLEQADVTLPHMQASLQAAEEKRARCEQALSDDREALAQLQTDIAQLEALVKEFHTREQAVRALKVQERNARDSMIAAQQALSALERQRARREQQEARREGLLKQKSIYEELRLAFGKNGIPAMIIETAIPELEVGANDILRRMTDGRMSLTMTTQREKVTGGMAETLDIQIADELGTRSYEMYSGGEAFRINFAIRVALSQLLARRAGASLRTLFLDEGFGTQDEDGRNKLVEAITAVQDDFDLILIITHLDDLRDSFPVHIVLDKTGEGSRVSVR